MEQTGWFIAEADCAMNLSYQMRTWVILALSQDCELDLEREGARPRFKDVLCFFKLGLAMKAKVQH